MVLKSSQTNKKFTLRRLLSSKMKGISCMYYLIGNLSYPECSLYKKSFRITAVEHLIKYRLERLFPDSVSKLDQTTVILAHDPAFSLACFPNVLN